MANLLEILKTFQAYGDLERKSNTLEELFWVIREIVKEDLQQTNVLRTETAAISFRSILMMYAQRSIEVGYVFSEVFLRSEYSAWFASSVFPRIIDLGGDPGLMSALYWKSVAPSAKITIVEANPATVAVMQRNVDRRNVQGIEIINRVVAGNADGMTSLHLHRAGHGFHTQDSIHSNNTPTDASTYEVKVPKIQLSTLLQSGENVDLLKVDIEGSETEVISELDQSGRIRQVSQIVMEFHHGTKEWPGNSLQTMLSLLEKNEFHIGGVHITSGKGLRKKTSIPSDSLKDIANSEQKIFVTFTALRQS